MFIFCSINKYCIICFPVICCIFLLWVSCGSVGKLIASTNIYASVCMCPCHKEKLQVYVNFSICVIINLLLVYLLAHIWCYVLPCPSLYIFGYYAKMRRVGLHFKRWSCLTEMEIWDRGYCVTNKSNTCLLMAKTKKDCSVLFQACRCWIILK